MMLTANCSNELPSTVNTCCIRSCLLNASTRSLFVNAATTFNFLIAHHSSKTIILLWEIQCCTVTLFIDLLNSVISCLKAVCLLFYYRAMLRRARLWDCMSSVRPSVCLSVTIRYRDHIGLRSLNSFRIKIRAKYGGRKREENKTA